MKRLCVPMLSFDHGKKCICEHCELMRELAKVKKFRRPGVRDGLGSGTKE